MKWQEKSHSSRIFVQYSIQSVTRIAEKTGGTSTFTHQNGTFTAKVMLCG